MRPFIALASDTEEFDAETHTRDDLQAFSLSISRKQNELARASIQFKTPQDPLSELADHRVLISQDGNLLFDGTLSNAPRGSVSATLYAEAIAEPSDLEDQVQALMEAAKISPFYDALFVPEGSEDDPVEVLAGYSSVLCYPRDGSAIFLADAMESDTVLTVMPTDDSISWDFDPPASVYTLDLSVAWQQLINQTFSDASKVGTIETMTPDALASSLPAVGASVGTGFTVLESSAEEDLDAFGRSQAEVVEVEKEISSDELDPAFVEEGVYTARASITPMNVSLRLLYTAEVNRSETCSISIPVGIQDAAIRSDTDDQEEVETIALREITPITGLSAWEAYTSYEEGDEITEDGLVFEAREDHTSGSDIDYSKWTSVGETEYISSRRVSSFLRSNRGQEALAHAVERIRARARIASRCVYVSFEAPMPSPHLVTDDCDVTIVHERLPGGSITGKLIEYSLDWEDGRRTFSGKIAASVGTGGEDTAALELGEDSPSSATGRVSWSVSGTGDEQKGAFEAGQSIPETVVTAKTTPVATTEFGHEVTATISGEIAVPQGVTL